jgi:hypothetical protein
VQVTHANQREAIRTAQTTGGGTISQVLTGGHVKTCRQKQANQHEAIRTVQSAQTTGGGTISQVLTGGHVKTCR